MGGLLSGAYDSDEDVDGVPMNDSEPTGDRGVFSVFSSKSDDEVSLFSSSTLISLYFLQQVLQLFLGLRLDFWT